MVKTNLLEWFPQGSLQSNPNANENEVAIPISSKQWLLLKKKQSDRARARTYFFTDWERLCI